MMGRLEYGASYGRAGSDFEAQIVPSEVEVLQLPKTLFLKSDEYPCQ